MKCRIALSGNDFVFKLEQPTDDGLPIPDVGSWSAHKHHFLGRYLDIFTTGMKDRRWSALHYIDLFAGAGLERVEGGTLDWGSALIAAQMPHRFTKLHLCESKRNRFQALKTRLTRFQQPNEPQLIHGDANEHVGEIVSQLPDGTLSVAFLDPYGLHLNFDTLRQLSTKRVDLIVFFPDHLDALRNWKINLQEPDSNLDRVLGTTAWRQLNNTVAPDLWGHELRKLYQQQIRSLGYCHFDLERISLPSGQPLYVLMFCSKHERGGDFWKKATSKKPSGQRTLEFD